MSFIVTPSAFAWLRSIVTPTARLSNVRSLSTTANSPLFDAAAFNFSIVAKMPLKSAGAQHHLDRQAAARRGQRRQQEREHLVAGDRVRARLHARLQVGRTARALRPVDEVHAGEAEIRTADTVQHEAGIRFRQRAEHLLDLRRVAFEVVQIRVLRRLHLQHDRALVLLRRQFTLHAAEQQADAQQDARAEHQHRRPRAEARMQQAPVRVRDARQRVFDRPRDTALRHPAVEQQRAEHRRERQRDHRGHAHRPRERESELAEQRAGQPAHQPDRRIHRNERDGHHDHRRRDLARAEQRARAGGSPDSMCR
jgi:hypothetical protein